MQRSCQLFILALCLFAIPSFAQDKLWRNVQADDRHYSPKRAVLIVEFGEKAHVGSKLHDAIQQAQREASIVQPILVADLSKLQTALDAREAGSVGMVILIRPPASEDIAKLPGLYPDMAFTIIDGEPSYALNVQNVEFQEEEGAFLLGAIAAIHTSERIAVMALEETPRAKRMQESFAAGVNHVRPEGNLLRLMNIRPTATQHTRLASTITSTYQNGTAIIFGVDDEIVEQALRAAKPERKIVISASAPTSSMDTSRLMTYMVKRYDLALLDVLHIYIHKQWHAGSIPLGVSGGYVDYSLNADNVDIFPKDSIDQIEAIKDYIGQGMVGKIP